MTRKQRMFGLWDSPVSAKSLSLGIRLSEPCWDTDGRTLGWVEGRSDRGVIVVQRDGEAPRDLTSDISVRAFVGYGGGDFTLAHGVAYFVGQTDQRIYRQELAGGTARPITPAFGATSSPSVSPDGRWVLFVHSYEEVDSIAVVDSRGQHWPQRLGESRDFYMQPAWCESGERVAWIEWDHPNMPWDGTELRVAELGFPEGGLPVVMSSWVAAGGPETAISQPLFAAGGELLYISDETGFGHVWRQELKTGTRERLTSGEGDFGRPAWNQGQRNVAITASGTLVSVRSREGFETLAGVTPDGSVADYSALQPEYTAVSHPVATPSGEKVALVASSGVQPLRVVVFDLADPLAGGVVRQRSSSETVPPAALSAPQAVSWTSFDGGAAHGLYFPPASERFEGTGAPPLIVLVHGGPTSQVNAGWAANVQYLATRGYAVLQPNYRGSTGYGRGYMLKLRRSWGIYDVQDSKFGAEAMAVRGLADPSRLVIMGGSAGGFTVLQSLVEIPGFYKAAVCMFGVANQFLLASDTHKFEQRYLDSMLGPLPEAATVYRERSPIFHVDRIVDPIAMFQGAIDRVVPREQSDTIVASLRSRGVPHEYHVYEGEGHGWRKSETVEAFYGAVDRFLKQYVLFA